MLLEDSFFSVTDDAICVKSGLDWFGRTYGRPTRDVLVRRCEIAAGAGPTIGSEMSGGVENVTAARASSVPFLYPIANPCQLLLFP